VTRRAITLAAISAVAVAGLIVRAQTPPQGQAMFRSTTDLVTVDVAVRTGGTPVGGLTAADFVLLDNGVPQHIDSIDVEAVPVDVTLIVDTSEAMSDYIGSVSSQVQRIAALVRPGDRLCVMQVDTYVTELFPMLRAATHPTIGEFAAGGLASVNDALAAALLRPVEPNRRHLIIALTDGIDTMSALGITAVRDIARQSGATLHLAWVTMEEVNPLCGSGGCPPPYWMTNQERLSEYRCAEGRCAPTHRFWAPYKEPPGNHHYPKDLAPMREVAEVTGGQMHDRGAIPFVERTVSAIFDKVYADYRRDYLLRYTRQGVPREGWHEIQVTIPAYPSYTINARRGYSIEKAAAAGPAAAPPATDAASRAPAGHAGGPLAKLIAAYGRADYEGAQAAARSVTNWASFINDFRALGSIWAATPHREEVLALEIANAALPSPHGDEHEAARRLVEAYSSLVRDPLPVDDFEHEWRRAGLAMLEAALDPDVTQSFLATALKYFPDDSRFMLGKAVAADQRWRQSTTPNAPAPPASRLNEVIAGYDAAMRFDDTAFEAHVREGWLLHRLGRNDAALAMLDAATNRPAGAPAPDQEIAYLRQLFRGHVLDALGRLDAAAGAFREALAAWPGAQSARIALMNAALRQGDLATARTLAEAVQTAPAVRDPWWGYWQGDYRFYAEWITRLRRQVR